MEFGNNQAIYLQIADHFCENILLEKWKEGDRIPSVREIAVNIEVNPNTVMRTFTYLQEKGIIFNKRGIGYFVADDGVEKTRALRKEDFINQELPRFFRAISLLNFTMEDIGAFYDQYQKKEPGEKTA
jgi:GntR family transcriptional regulator